MENKILSLFQLCDSNFPTGAFSQSFGLETYIQNDEVHDSDSFAKWLQIYLSEQLVYSDGLASSIVYDALLEKDLEKIWKLDRMLTVQNFARESRDGTQRMGDRLLDISESIYQAQMLAVYRERIRNKLSFGHSAVVFTMVGHHLGVPKETTILYYLYSTIIGLVQNAVRAIPLGQTAGQKLIYQFQKNLTEATEKILKLTEEDFGIISPGLELSQMQHERVNVRIFSS